MAYSREKLERDRRKAYPTPPGFEHNAFFYRERAIENQENDDFIKGIKLRLYGDPDITPEEMEKADLKLYLERKLEITEMINDINNIK